MGGVADVKGTDVHSRDTIFFLNSRCSTCVRVIRHDLNLGNTHLCGAERGNTEKLPRVIKEPLLLFKSDN